MLSRRIERVDEDYHAEPTGVPPQDVRKRRRWVRRGGAVSIVASKARTADRGFGPSNGRDDSRRVAGASSATPPALASHGRPAR